MKAVIQKVTSGSVTGEYRSISGAYLSPSNGDDEEGSY